MLRAAEHLVHKHGICLLLWEKHRTEDAPAFARTGRILTRMPLVDYGKLSVPTLIVHGEFDDVARQEDLALRFREIPSNEKQHLVLPGLGHMALIERNRHPLTHALLNFLEAPGPAW